VWQSAGLEVHRPVSAAPPPVAASLDRTLRRLERALAARG